MGWGKLGHVNRTCGGSLMPHFLSLPSSPSFINNSSVLRLRFPNPSTFLYLWSIILDWHSLKGKVFFFSPSPVQLGLGIERLLNNNNTRFRLKIQVLQLYISATAAIYTRPDFTQQPCLYSHPFNCRKENFVLFISLR